MEKWRGKRWLAVVVVGAVLAIVVGLCRWARPLMKLRFLDGRRPTARYTYGEYGSVDSYSFADDFNSVCAEAQAELAERGFVRGAIFPGGVVQPFDLFAPGRSFIRHRPNDIVQVVIVEIRGMVFVEVRWRQARSVAGRWIRHLIDRLRGRLQGRPQAFPVQRELQRARRQAASSDEP